MAENAKEITRRVFEDLWTKGDLDVADRMFAGSFVGHDPNMSETIRGPDELKAYVRMYRAAFPDLNVTVDDQIAEGDRIVTRFSAHGVHRGELFGIQPTGNSVTIVGLVEDRIAEGRIVESWISYDMLGLMRQLGYGLAPRARAPAAEQAQPS